MKKLLLIAAVMLGLGGLAKADTLLIPQGGGDALASSDYGGVSYSTVSISTNSFLAFSGPGSLVGFTASSSTAIGDYIQFFDTETVLANPALETYRTNDEFARIYMSSQTALGGTIINYGTTYKFPAPVRIKRGLASKTSTPGIISLTLYWTKFGR